MGPVPRQLNFDQSLYISLYGAKSMPFPAPEAAVS